MRRVIQARRRRYANYLRGRGLEIGALGNPMPLPNASEVVYSDLLTPEQIDSMYPGSRHPDIVSDSESFPTVASEEFDFVVANHVLEHVTDPIGALAEWHRIIKPEGLLLISLPDKRYTFDATRPRTRLDHLIADHLSDANPQQRNLCHLVEWAEHVERLEPGSARFNEWIEAQQRNGFAVHNHVWILQDLVDLLLHVGDVHGAAFELVKWNDTSLLGNEFTLLLRRSRNSTPTRFALARAAGMLRAPLHRFAAALRQVRRFQIR